jgi:hypothetical protein
MDPEGLRILREWDVEAARKRFARLPLGIPVKHDVVEAGMHKARLMAGPRVFGNDACVESRDWLRDHGYSTPGSV